MRSAAQRARILRQRLLTSTAIVAGAWLAYGVLVGGDDDDFEAAATDEERGYYVNAATLTEFGPDGTPRIVLRADTIEQRRSDQSVLLSNLKLDYQTAAAGAWTVTADQGRMPAAATALQLSGDVLVTGTEARGEAVIRTDQLSYDTVTSVIQTAEPVAVQFGAHHLEGRGLRVVLNDGTLRLESNVHGRFVP
ncbi:MAG: LPS export ABC transporter periplasmic protein LptC [Steroidobacteraceae bacterium]|nr:LPS export ABC transporter periplasmic protein LptC [Steroidobacteraceae bacterium]